LSRVIKSPPVSRQAYHVPEPDCPNSNPGEGRGEPLDPEALARRRLEEAEREAHALVEQARADSERLLEQAGAEAKRLKELAWEEGLNEGRRQGREEIEAAMRAQAESFERSALTLLESLQREKERLLRKTEPELIELACSIAGRIVRREVEQDDEAVLRIVQKAIDLATEKTQLLIRLHPTDIEWVRQHCEQLRATHDHLEQILFEPDTRIERGGCIIETKAGNVDARLERQLGELRRNLQESM